MFSNYVQIKYFLFTLIFVIISLFLIIIRYFIFAENKIDAMTFQNNIEASVWEWRRLPIDNKDRIIDFFAKEGIDTIYIDISDYIENPLSDIEEELHSYIFTANQKNIKVQALIGSPLWTSSSHRYLLDKTVDFVIEYNQKYSNENFDGLHIDIEPYKLTVFESQPNEILKDYLAEIKKVVQKINTAEINNNLKQTFRLGIAIPYWFNGSHEIIKTVQWEGEEKTMFKHIVKIINVLPQPYIVIMAYRNQAVGEKGSIALVQNEIKFTNKYAPRIKIIVGQEMDNVEPKEITFYGRTKSDFKKSASEIISEFSNYKTFAGIAVNNAKSYEIFILESKK